MTTPGIHALILVVEINRFTEENALIFETYLEIFGKDLSKFLIVLFTNRDALERDGYTLEDAIQTCPKPLKDILDRNCQTYIAFDNTKKVETNDDVDKLLEKIDFVIARNGRRCYTNEVYEQAEKEYRRRVDDLHKNGKLQMLIERFFRKRQQMPPSQGVPETYIEEMRKELHLDEDAGNRMPNARANCQKEAAGYQSIVRLAEPIGGDYQPLTKNVEQAKLLNEDKEVEDEEDYNYAYQRREEREDQNKHFVTDADIRYSKFEEDYRKKQQKIYDEAQDRNRMKDNNAQREDVRPPLNPPPPPPYDAHAVRVVVREEYEQGNEEAVQGLRNRIKNVVQRMLAILQRLFRRER